MLVWLIGTVLGFLALNALVIVLGAASTARYEEERRDLARLSAGHGERDILVAEA
ncbi:hypothetical protein [Blastococcus sp. KM273129]|uniref:hypothetical protein n=1 Tax=Blastococcus sp. KM273129 TaxID=2570315 RepID=UPI001F406E40|nr:hypothetical protein [Blastococcus sp. KM273129]